MLVDSPIHSPCLLLRCTHTEDSVLSVFTAFGTTTKVLSTDDTTTEWEWDRVAMALGGTYETVWSVHRSNGSLTCSVSHTRVPSVPDEETVPASYIANKNHKQSLTRTKQLPGEAVLEGECVEKGKSDDVSLEMRCELIDNKTHLLTQTAMLATTSKRSRVVPSRRGQGGRRALHTDAGGAAPAPDRPGEGGREYRLSLIHNCRRRREI